MPVSLKEPSAPGWEDIEILRRQVVELQRISSLGVLAGSVMHELNNALTPILNYAKLGLRNPDPEFQKRAFERILEASERAGQLTRGMLGLARPSDGQRPVTELARLTEEVLKLTAKELQKHRIHVDYLVEGNPRAGVNSAQIQQVLLNLIINARQAMREGGSLTVRIGTDAAARYAEISIADTGEGIAPRDLKRIFEPFYTTKSGPDSAGLGGTGLGLPICRDIVVAHKGRLRVESKPGKGSKFTIRLPAVPENSKQEAGAA